MRLTWNNRIKHLIIRLAITLFVIAGIFVFIPPAESRSNPKTSSEGISFIKEQETKDISKVDVSVTKIAYEEETNGMSVWEKLNYLNTYIIGDSRCGGFNYFDFDSNHLIAEASTTIRFIKDKIDQIEAAKPSYLVISFGMNDMGLFEFDPDNYWETGKDYVAEFQEYVDLLHEKVPDTTLIINLIMPATEAGIVRQNRWMYVEEWNADIIKLCEENEIPYVDITQICYDNPDFYQDDGVHFYGDIYEVWAEEILKVIESTL